MGIIPLKHRQLFLDRKRVDYRKYKDLSDEELEAMADELPVQPPIFFRLKRLQRICFLIGAHTGSFCFFNDTGTGKTLLSIALIRYFKRLGEVQRILVLVPSKIVKLEWQLELEKHSPHSEAVFLEGSSEQKWRYLESSNSLFVVETYAGLTRMVCDNVEGELVINKKKLAKLVRIFQGFVCDESVNVGNHNTIPFRVCRQISKNAKMVFTLTGTPFNRDPVLMWAQMFLVDDGYTLGETLGLFRSVFCKEVTNAWSGAPEYEFDSKKTDLLNQLLANRSISFPADVGSLPGVTYIKKYVYGSKDALDYYDAFRKRMRAAHGIDLQNNFVKLRQISSGFVGYDNQDDKKVHLTFPDNPKLDLLLSIITNINPAHKVIVFYDFTYSGLRIRDELKKLKIKNSLIYGSTKNVEEERRAFMEDPSTQVLILQNRLGVGINVQIAKYGIFYESPVSGILRKQCEARVRRQHSEHESVLIYDLLMRYTEDERILDFHQEGKDLFEAVVRGEATI